MIDNYVNAPILNRLLASIIDSFISILVFVLIGIPLYTGIRQVFGFEGLEGIWLLFIFSPCVIWGYYIFMEYRWGFTLGKKITGLRVINENNESLTISNAIIRTICKIIPFNNISILVNRENRGWHDQIAGTVVVRDYALD